MAGIGFELRKLLQKHSFGGDSTALFYASIIAAGPWIACMLCLASISVYASFHINQSGVERFRSIVIYSYCFSAILVGLLQLVVTRYMADQYYIRRYDKTLPSFLNISAVVGVASALVAALAYSRLPMPAVQAFWGCLLFIAVCLTWVSMIYIGVIRDYKTLVVAFFGGTFLAIAAAVLLGRAFQFTGYLAGFTIGQFTIYILILAKLLTEFRCRNLFDRETFTSFATYKELIAIGVLLNLTLWIDKIIFWYAPESRSVLGMIRVNDVYDTLSFYAYLTILPSMGIFLLRMETSFNEHYNDYFGTIISKSPMRQILKQKKSLIDDLRVNLRYLFTIQVTISGVCIVFSGKIIEHLHFLPFYAPIFRALLFGVFLQALTMTIIVILFYFDQRKKVLASIFTFFFLMASLSILSIRLGSQYYGYGYAVANLIALCIVMQCLEGTLKNLEYISFTQQLI